MNKKIRRILVAITFVPFATAVHAGDWHDSWSSQKGAAAKRCAKTFEDYQLQAVCMDNEKSGYDKMQGDFGLPSSVANSGRFQV
jgi:hypothetical protein